MLQIICKFSSIIVCSFLMGCSQQIEEKISADYMPVFPSGNNVAAGAANGTIYSSSSGGLLNLDKRASKVGDVLTVAFVEAFQATKSQNASTSRSTSNEIDLPNLLPSTSLMDPLSAALQSSSNNSFSGSGSAAQSNSLTGQMSVHIVKILPGGNLAVLGQKRLVLNKGEEYIRVSGIVRPLDISSDNIISSDRIANANIQYIGAGNISDSSKNGWLSNLLTSVSPI